MTWFRCGMKKGTDDAVLNSLIDRTITTITSHVTTIGTSALRSCHELISATFDEATSVGTTAFYDCTALTNITIPKVVTIGSNAFQLSPVLNNLVLDKVELINSSAFASCRSLDNVTLKASSMCVLNNVNAFSGTAFASDGTGGTIYVPSDLVSTYEANATWAALLALNANNSIQAITT